MKGNLKPTLIFVLLFAALVACAKKHTGGAELRSSGDIVVNGTGFDGSIHAGTKVLYTLKDIQKNRNYTLRTEIGFLSNGQTADGTLTVDIYQSQEAFKNDPNTTVASARPFNNLNIYEVNFAPEASGDFVVVIGGTSRSTPGVQFFFNLRVLSADPSAITATLIPVTVETGTAYEAIQANPLNPGSLNIYNGGDVASSGTFTISLKSNATVTLAHPQIFVYNSNTLATSSLTASSIPTATNFIVTRFSTGIPDNDHVEMRDTNLITDVPFPGGGSGPFIVLKGFLSAVTYTLSVGP